MCVGVAAVSTPIFDADHLSSSIYVHRSIDTQISDATHILDSNSALRTAAGCDPTRQLPS